MTANGADTAHDPTAVDTGEEVDLRQYFRVLLQYKWLILAVAVVVATGVALWTLRQPKIYQASCTLEFDPNPPQPLGQEVSDVRAGPGNYWANKAFIETQHRIISSRSVAERVVRKLDLHHDPEFGGVSEEKRDSWDGMSVKSAASKLQGKLSVSGVEETRLVKLKITDDDPEQAATLVNAVAEAYIKKTKEDRLGSTVSALEWLADQLDKLRTKLRDSELALHQFKKKHDVLSVSLEDQQNEVANDIQTFSSELRKIRTRRIKLQARVERLRKANADDPMKVNVAAFDENTRIENLRKQIEKKQTERETLAVQYGKNHPKMKALEAHISALRDQLRSAIDDVINAAQADLHEIRNIEEGLRHQLRKAHQEGFELNRREIRFRRLKRKRENNEQLYNMVLKRTTETEMTKMMQTTFVRMVDRALVPGGPISPNYSTNMAAGMGAGVGIGIALAFLLSQLDRRIKTAEDVEALGLPVLGVLPRIDEANSAATRYSRYRRRRHHQEPPSTPENRDTIVQSHPMSAAAECCRTIRTNLTFMSASRPSQSLLITSSLPREGKTTVGTNLAITIAQSGKRVLLIDSDLRRPRIHRIFKASGDIGLTTLLAGETTFEQATTSTDIPSLDILPSGPIPPNPSELLHGRRFQDILQTAEAHYDRVLFDSPPLAAVTDAAVIAPQVGGALLVVKSQQTTRDGLRSGLRQLRSVGAHIIGGIMNEIDLTSSGYRYQGYYYYTYGYSDIDDHDRLPTQHSPPNTSDDLSRQPPPQ